jgi:hypothetical protein
MSTRIWAKQLTCDRCSAESEILENSPRPPTGWVQVNLSLPNGVVPWHDLCPDCAKLSMGELLTNPIRQGKPMYDQPSDPAT